MATLPSLITFGSLGPLPTQVQILQLQEEFHRKASLFRPLIETVRHLDSLWAKMIDQDPALNVIDGRGAIKKLEGVLSGTVNEHIHDDMRNIFIVPMTVLLHVVQYLSFIEHSGVANHNSVLENVAVKGGVQGLCAGLLSAQTVASATTIEDIVALWCTSLRLAFCIGAYVDINQVGNDGHAESATGFVNWKVPVTLEDIQNVLQKYQNIYIAAVRDERALIVTAPAETATELKQDLSRHGASFHTFDLPGRYHTSIHADVPPKIIKACEGLLDPRFGDRELVRSNVDGRIIPRQNAVRDVLEAILARSVNWVQTLATAAQSVDETSERSFILSVGGDSITESVTKTHHIVRVQAVMSEDSIHDLPLRVA